jgi:FkbM family methyltransferase
MTREIRRIDVRGTPMQFACHNNALRHYAQMIDEPEVLDLIDEIPQAAVFYDLGACEGRFALYAALRGVRTFAFEPELLNFRTLLENQELNGLSADTQLTALRLAVGNYTGRGVMRVAQPYPGGHLRNLVQAGMPGVSGSQTTNNEQVFMQGVDVVALDAWIERNRLPVPNYVKVDVDGSEIHFLEGARRTLKSTELRAIMFELSHDGPVYEQAEAALAVAGFQPVSEHFIQPGLFNVMFRRAA